MPLLAVEQLSVDYGNTRAVDQVSFTVETGEILALVGESGSGKSSVALALTRLLSEPPARIGGSILFEGEDLLTCSDSVLRRIRGGKISYVFQEPASALNPVLTIGEQLLEAILQHTPARGKQARDAAIDWLNRVDIAEAAQRFSAYPHELSGGMQQRVCLAMALSSKPLLLVADEPTTALDVTTQVQILKLIRDLQKQLGLAVLLISHDLMVVERISHRVGVLAAGKLVELGSVRQILQQPAHDYTRQMVKNRQLLEFEGRAHG